MDERLLLTKIFWNLQSNWHRRSRPDVQALSMQDTVKALQRLPLAEHVGMLQQ